MDPRITTDVGLRVIKVASYRYMKNATVINAVAMHRFKMQPLSSPK